MAEIITAARPYAQAAFEDARGTSDLSGWMAALEMALEFVSNPEVGELIKNPRFGRGQIGSLLFAAIGERLNQHQRNFMGLLVENQRLLMLAEIVSLFRDMKAEAEMTIGVLVDSAFELTAGQQQKIVGALEARMGRKVALQCRLDQSLLGGVVIRAGDKVIDGSALARLDELSVALA